MYKYALIEEIQQVEKELRMLQEESQHSRAKAIINKAAENELAFLLAELKKELENEEKKIEAAKALVEEKARTAASAAGKVKLDTESVLAALQKELSKLEEVKAADRAANEALKQLTSLEKMNNTEYSYSYAHARNYFLELKKALEAAAKAAGVYI